MFLQLPAALLLACTLAHAWEYSFPVPEVMGAGAASEAGCCQFGQMPLPASASLKRPSLVGLGTHKSATSFVYNLLKKHPQFVAPTHPQLWGGNKELMQFNTYPQHPHSFQRYLRSWRPDAATNTTSKTASQTTTSQTTSQTTSKTTSKALHYFEFTSTYLHTPFAACRMKALLPNAKFLVILRDPVERALSHWNMQQQLWRKDPSGWKPPPFPEAVQRELTSYQRAGCSFGWAEASALTGRQKSWNDCFKCWMIPLETQLADQYCQRQTQPDLDQTPCWPRLNSGMFLGFGQYAAPIAWWLRFFPPSSFLFLHSHDLRTDALSVGNKIAEFMGTDSFTPDMMTGLDTPGVQNLYRYTINSTDRPVAAALAELKTFYDKPVRDTMALLRSLGYTDFHDMVADLQQQ